MGIISPSGSLTPTLSQNEETIPAQNNTSSNVTAPEEIIGLNDSENIKELSGIRDVFVNRTSYNPERFADVYGTLLAYPSGAAITVTYYNQFKPNTSIKTNPTDISLGRSPNHESLVKIYDFELRVTSDFSFEYDTTNGKSNFETEVVFYSGFKPAIGDLFLYQYTEGKIGVFKVNSVNRLSIYQASYIAAKVSLWKNLDKETLDGLNARVGEEVWFDKQRFLAGNATLLKHKSYVDLNELRQLRQEMIQYYNDIFYCNTSGSIFREDGVYDPYVVQFLSNKLSVRTDKVPRQLMPSRMFDYNKSIWYQLVNSKYIDIKNLIPTYYIDTLRLNIYSTTINTLINRRYVKLHKEDPDQSAPTHYSYVYTPEFYNGVFNNTDLDKGEIVRTSDKLYLVGIDPFEMAGIKTMMSDFEQNIYVLIRDKNLNIDECIETIRQYQNLHQVVSFYYIPIYIHMADIAINKIT